MLWNINPFSIFDIKHQTPQKLFSVLKDTYFTTVTCNSWIPILEQQGCKEVILNTFQYIQTNNKAVIYGFVIMPNHFHVLWAVKETEIKYLKKAVTSVTSHKMLQIIQLNNPGFLNRIVSTQADRKFHFWERRPYWKNVSSESVFRQKLQYIHLNPIRKKWTLAPTPEDYYWSSARSYFERNTQFEFLTLFQFQ
jgi:REP element-mobilizing transposase RayT